MQPYDGVNGARILDSLIDAFPTEVRMEDEHVSGKLTEDEWDLANEHASYLSMYLDEDPSVIPMLRREALSGLAFARVAELCYDDSEWEWVGDFRDNPKLDPTDSSNEFDPECPEKTLSKFRVSGNSVTVSLVDDAETHLCNDLDVTMARIALDESAVHVTGAINPEEEFFTFYGARTFEMASNFSWTDEFSIPGEVDYEDFDKYHNNIPDEDDYDDFGEYHDELKKVREKRAEICFWEGQSLPNQIPLTEIPDLPPVQTPTV